MKLNKKLLATGVLAASMLAGQAWGAVSAAEAAKLGDSLTPMAPKRPATVATSPPGPVV